MTATHMLTDEWVALSTTDPEQVSMSDVVELVALTAASQEELDGEIQRLQLQRIQQAVHNMTAQAGCEHRPQLSSPEAIALAPPERSDDMDDDTEAKWRNADNVAEVAVRNLRYIDPLKSSSGETVGFTNRPDPADYRPQNFDPDAEIARLSAMPLKGNHVDTSTPRGSQIKVHKSYYPSRSFSVTQEVDRYPGRRGHLSIGLAKLPDLEHDCDLDDCGNASVDHEAEVNRLKARAKKMGLVNDRATRRAASPARPRSARA
jgi:hypothetical protein